MRCGRAGYCREISASVRAADTTPLIMDGNSADRSIPREGTCADFVLFDPASVQDNGTFTDPHQYPSGIEYVLVNGEVAVDEGHYSGALPGNVLRHNTVM